MATFEHSILSRWPDNTFVANLYRLSQYHQLQWRQSRMSKNINIIFVHYDIIIRIIYKLECCSVETYVYDPVYFKKCG